MTIIAVLVELVGTPDPWKCHRSTSVDRATKNLVQVLFNWMGQAFVLLYLLTYHTYTCRISHSLIPWSTRSTTKDDSCPQLPYCTNNARDWRVPWEIHTLTVRFCGCGTGYDASVMMVPLAILCICCRHKVYKKNSDGMLRVPFFPSHMWFCAWFCLDLSSILRPDAIVVVDWAQSFVWLQLTLE